MIEFERRATTAQEDKYTFTPNESKDCVRLGLIGYLRADFGSSGEEFHSSWWDKYPEVKSDDFKREFDDLINALREEGDILHKRAAMSRYCFDHPQAKMKSDIVPYYGVRIDTENYIYFLRLCPLAGMYNLYCYCYQRTAFETATEGVV